MKSMSKKILALALTLVLALSLGIAAYAEGESVAVTGVTVTESATLTLGTTKTLTATVAPANATNKAVTWTTSNASVATVDGNGKVTAAGIGNATITATTADGSFTDTCAVTVTNTFAAEFSVILEDYDDYLDLEVLVAGYAYDWAETNLGHDVDVDYIGGVTGLDYGEVDDDDGYYWLDDSDDYYKLPVTDNFSCKVELDDVEYKVNVALTLYTTELSDDFGINGGNLSSLATTINTLMGLEYPGEDLDHIYFDDAELEGGTLYASSAMTSEAWDEVYTKNGMSALFYLPNGSGETSYLSYTAYTDDDDEDEEISGTIALTADSFMLLDYTISNQDTLTLNAEDFEEAYLELDDDYAYLDAVKFTSGISNGSSKGYFYLDYETEGDDADKVSNSSSKKYYVDPDDEEIGIDTITYVPGKNTKSLTYTITYKAFGVDEDGKEVSKTSGKTGYLRINVVEAADLEVTSGPGELTAIDAEWFQDFVAENATTTQKKSYVVTRVVFNNVPASAKEGYLYTDGDELTSGNKTFYMDPKDNQNDLNDLYFKGGNTVGTKRVNFTIYGKKATSTSSSDSTVATGSIDFIVGPSRKLQYGVSASQTLSFLGSLPNIQALGNNNNAYIVFSNLPNIGGKLVYTEAGVETPVTAGTRYYLTYTAGQKYLGYVSFAPSYSSSKTARTVTLNVRAGNASGKEVDGTFDIIVTYAASSMYFTDVQIYNNAQAQKYADSVDYLRVKGITRGNNAAGTTFGLSTNVTRAEFVTFLYRAAGQPAVTGLTNTFTDVSATTHKDFYNAILWAVKNGITNGKGNNKFDPDANVTHEELLTFLYRYDVTYKKNPGTMGTLYGFIDGNQVASWAQDAAKWAAYKGVINYYTDGYNLLPTTAGTRGTVALWLHRMLTL